MSLFGSLYTAESGLAAQANAFGNISDNVANSQTVGFKGVNTAFQDYLTQSDAQSNDPGNVNTTPQYTNNVQGTVTASSDPLALAISGQGFFAVQEANGESTSGSPTFSTQQYYTRTGDFALTKDGYLENSAGEYLQGWKVDTSTGVTNQSTLTTIKVDQSAYAPIQTGTIDLSANLPATPAATATTASQVTVYDSVGTAHNLDLSWAQDGTIANTWVLSIESPDNVGSAGTLVGQAIVTFGTAAGSVTNGGSYDQSAPDGTISGISNGGTVGDITSYSSITDGSAATIAFNATLDGTAQAITLNLGSYGGTDGVTQFAGTTYNQRNVKQDGVTAGAFSSVNTDANGNVVANYDNGEQKTIYQIPLVTFAAPDALQRVNGQAFIAHQASGAANTQYVNTNAAGQLVTQSVEASNVDIATQFSKLIVAQQSYAANTKVMTAANTLLQQTIAIIQ